MSTVRAERNCSIDSFRFIIAIWVVLSHTDVLLNISDNLHEINRYVSRVTVVYLLIVSGYYFIKTLLEGTSNAKSLFFSFFKIYLFWTAIYYSVSFITSVLLGGESLENFLIQRVVYFFLDGSFFHLWFFPALLYSMLAVMLAHRLFGEKGILFFAVFAILLNILCAFGAGYAFIGQQIPVLSTFYNSSVFYPVSLIIGIGFSSYSAGYFIYQIKKHQRIKPKTSLILLAIMAVLYLGESAFLVLVMHSTESPQVFFTVYPMAICLMLVSLNYPMPKWSSFASYARKSAGFIYYVHPLILLGLQMVFQLLGWDIGAIMLMALTMFIILAANFICIKWNNRFTRLLLGIRGNAK